MAPEYPYDLSSHDTESIAYRDMDLTTEIMGELGFAETLYYTWTGNHPDEGEQRVMTAMLNSLMLHGVTPSTLVSRTVLVSEPDAVQAAVASAINGVGSRLIGPMKECSEDLHRVSAADDREDAIETLVEAYRRGDGHFPGIGHPHLDPVDPRAERLFELAEAEDISGEHVEILKDIRNAFDTGLPINATGAIAALTADMGLPPAGARGIAIVSRTAGVVAEVLAEQEAPFASEVWQHVDEHATPGGARD